MSINHDSNSITSPLESAPMAPLRPVGLIYTPLTKKALLICFAAHNGQTDKSGLPYVIHPLHLAEQLETEEEVCTALLHDVVEDSHYTFSDLRDEGFPEAVLEALGLLTHDEYTPYLEYVVRLRSNPIARRVKLADLTHNSDLARLNTVTVRDRRRVLKYRMAQAMLEDDRFHASLGLFHKRLPLSLEHPFFLSVFYDQRGTVERYSIDVEAEKEYHYGLEASQGERLQMSLNPNRTLPEALADWAEGGCTACRVESMLRQRGITFQIHTAM